jgi:hypothetical protein
VSKKCKFKCGDWNCGSYQFNLYKNDIDQGDLCDVHYWQTKAQRPWAGLTDADIERIKLITYEKETNADGEEQEAVNIDWLIKTTEHFCKEKNT